MRVAATNEQGVIPRGMWSCPKIVRCQCKVYSKSYQHFICLQVRHSLHLNWLLLWEFSLRTWPVSNFYFIDLTFNYISLCVRIKVMFIYTRFGVNFIWILKVVSLVPVRKTYSHEYIYDEIKELEIVDLFILIIEDHRVIHYTSFIHSSWPSHTHRKVPCVPTLPFWIKLEAFHQTLYSCLPWKWQWVCNLPFWTAYTCLVWWSA